MWKGQLGRHGSETENDKNESNFKAVQSSKSSNKSLTPHESLDQISTTQENNENPINSDEVGWLIQINKPRLSEKEVLEIPGDTTKASTEKSTKIESRLRPDDKPTEEVDKIVPLLFPFLNTPVLYSSDSFEFSHLLQLLPFLFINLPFFYFTQNKSSSSLANVAQQDKGKAKNQTSNQLPEPITSPTLNTYKKNLTSPARKGSPGNCPCLCCGR